jgi:signal transduction histidine kinase
LEPEELLGRSAFEYVHPDDKETMAAAIQRALTNPDAPVVVEYRFRHVSGDWRVLQSVGRNLPGMAAQGFIVVNSRDVTESRGLQEQLAQAQKLQAVGTLAGGIAHDFNNLLGAIIGNADLALFDVPGNAPAARFLEEILKASHRAKELVERILAFSRPRPAQRQVLQMGPIVEDAARLLRSTLPAGVELRIQVPAQLPPVRVDGSAIHQITLNLGTNSWHALHGKPGQIAISLERAHLDEQFCRAHSGVRPGEFVCLRVADNGSGMDAATMRRIFEPFFTTKPTGKGTGLGLSVVHGLVQSHGGAIVVESEPGVGSDFRVYFPAAQGPAAEVAPKPPAAAGDARGGGGARILLVDDEKALLEIGRQALERRGFRVSAHASPVEAFKHFEAGPEMVDLLITDYNMPGMSGLQLAEAVLRQRPGMPVLVASGFLLPEQVAVAQAAGVTRVLAKPYSAEVLCQAALELTGAGPGGARAGQ